MLPQLTASPHHAKVLLIESSDDVRLATGAPVKGAGADCVAVSSVSAALGELARIRPQLVLVDARSLALGMRLSCQMLKSHPNAPNVPLVLLVDRDTPSELIEEGYAAGVDDCIVRPVRVDHLQQRLAVVTARPEAVPVRVARRNQRTVWMVGPPSRCGQLAALLELSGYHLVQTPAREFRAQVATQLEVELVVLVSDVNRTEAGTIAVWAGGRARLVSLDVGIQGVAGVDDWSKYASSPNEQVVKQIDLLFSRLAVDLRAHQRVPFFCPVEFRESGAAGEWASGFSFDLSPGGIFLRTLSPIRPKAPVELRIHLTTTREELEGTGVVAWANGFSPQRVASYPVGMGVQFLGMSPGRLSRLRALCSTFST